MKESPIRLIVDDQVNVSCTGEYFSQLKRTFTLLEFPVHRDLGVEIVSILSTLEK